jgi:hypothetical protein
LQAKNRGDYIGMQAKIGGKKALMKNMRAENWYILFTL